MVVCEAPPGFLPDGAISIQEVFIDPPREDAPFLFVVHDRTGQVLHADPVIFLMTGVSDVFFGYVAS